MEIIYAIAADHLNIPNYGIILIFKKANVKGKNPHWYPPDFFNHQASYDDLLQGLNKEKHPEKRYATF